MDVVEFAKAHQNGVAFKEVFKEFGVTLFTHKNTIRQTIKTGIHFSACREIFGLLEIDIAIPYISKSSCSLPFLFFVLPYVKDDIQKIYIEEELRVFFNSLPNEIQDSIVEFNCYLGYNSYESACIVLNYYAYKNLDMKNDKLYQTIRNINGNDNYFIHSLFHLVKQDNIIPKISSDIKVNKVRRSVKLLWELYNGKD